MPQNDLPFEARDPFLGRAMAGKYLIDAFLGAGAMGRVYRATQRPLDKTVAVKVLNANLGADSGTLQRFLREAKAASRFDHPNSVAVFDFGIEPDGTAYIVMEYLRGESLDDLLQREGTLPAPRCVAIMSQVLAALAEAHEAGIVHRDIKPENIMLVSRSGDDGDGETVKVADFGIAKMLDDDDPRAAAKLTATGITPGSPAYMSPEQAQAKPLDGRSDLYQCGVILYEMITGEIPFTADNAIGVIMMHITEPAPSAKMRNPRCPEMLDAIIAKAMAKSPADRFSNARAMRQALKGVAPDQVIPTGKISLRDHPRPSALSPQPMHSGLADTLTSVTAPGGVAAVQAPTPASAADSPATRTVRWTRIAPIGAVAVALTIAVVFLSPRERAAAVLSVSSAAPPTSNVPAETPPSGQPTPDTMADRESPQPTVAPIVLSAPTRVERLPVGGGRRSPRERSPATAPPIVATATPVVAPEPRPVPAPVETPPPAPVVVPPPTPAVAAPPLVLRGVRGSLTSLQVGGGIGRNPFQGRATQATEAVARCVQRAAEARGGASALGAPVTVSVVVAVRDRRADEVHLSGSGLASGCRDAVLGAFRGDLPQGEDAEYDVRLSVHLEPQL